MLCACEWAIGKLPNDLVGEVASAGLACPPTPTRPGLMDMLIPASADEVSVGDPDDPPPDAEPEPLCKGIAPATGGLPSPDMGVPVGGEPEEEPALP